MLCGAGISSFLAQASIALPLCFPFMLCNKRVDYVQSVCKLKSPIAQAACGALHALSEEEVASMVCKDSWGADYAKVLIRPLRWTLRGSLDMYYVVGERHSELAPDQLVVIAGALPVAPARPAVNAVKDKEQGKRAKRSIHDMLEDLCDDPVPLLDSSEQSVSWQEIYKVIYCYLYL